MYVNWKKSQHLICSSKWYSFNTIVDYLHDLKLKIILSTINDKGPDTLIFPVTLPVSRDKRLSSNECYLCENIGNWKVKLDAITSLSRRLKNGDGYIETRVVSFINQLVQLMEDYTINRQRFESYFDLVWKEEFIHNLNECDNLFCVLFKRVLSLNEYAFNTLKSILVFYQIKRL